MGLETGSTNSAVSNCCTPGPTGATGPRGAQGPRGERGIPGASQGPSGVALASSIVDFVSAVGNNGGGTGSYSSGVELWTVRNALVSGIRFKWTRPTARTIRCRLVAVVAGVLTVVRTVDAAVNGVGVYVGEFLTTYDAPIASRLLVSIWETSGADYSAIDGVPVGTVVTPFWSGAYFVKTASIYWNGGVVTVEPTAASVQQYPVEPVMTAY